jgi:hypothetical protein
MMPHPQLTGKVTGPDELPTDELEALLELDCFG